MQSLRLKNIKNKKKSGELKPLEASNILFYFWFYLTKKKRLTYHKVDSLFIKRDTHTHTLTLLWIPKRSSPLPSPKSNNNYNKPTKDWQRF